MVELDGWSVYSSELPLMGRMQELNCVSARRNNSDGICTAGSSLYRSAVAEE